QGGNGAAAAFAGLLVVNALFNPYTPIYDLVLLGPAAVFAVEACMIQQNLGRNLAARAGCVQLALAALFFGPHLSQALAKTVGVQCFPLVLLAIAAGSIALAARTGT